jgi:N-methylhydantoinase A
LRVISVQRGIDPRGHILTSFGGAGGLHVCALAEALGMRRAMVPVHAGVLSALGMLATPPGRLLTRTWLGKLSARTDAEVAARLRELAEEGLKALTREGLSPSEMRTELSLDLRYLGQSATLNLAWRGLDRTAEDFHRLHLARYGHRLDVPVELVNLRARVTAEPALRALPPRHFRVGGPPPEQTQVFGWDDPVLVLRREHMGADARVTGPAVIVDPFATTWLDGGWTAWCDVLGNLQLEGPPSESA